MYQPSHSTIFVGRAAELSRLMEFCTETDLASALRIAMLCGDAGIGKSALIEQLIPRLSAKNITVIHAKIYPDSAFSPLLVLAQSLSASAALSKLVENQSAGANVLVPGSLRRIARLRRSVIIIEDTHLMPSEAMEEFSTILTAIADEPVAMILATRPGVHPANSIAARWIVEQFPLLGLQAAEVQEYLEQSFDPKVSQEATRILCKTTLLSLNNRD
ncbi:MAG: ATP-binding protein [Armatimonadetes bacterium]|nr:ATP-binding protein [Armatimonadota bacterium]